ncbi:hypothetical protein BSLG_003682 [Batrachochytrium salamandrivorans]|nr:hypothetical protein BSLG_003682 [Batrachochytrium salamandrivorans]
MATSTNTVPLCKRVELLQSRPECIRNICILAHVDHGKTTLADGLLSANGIISSKLAGKVRYLDSRPDEQERGITMKSSGVSLFFSVVEQSRLITDALNADPIKTSSTTTEYLINLIDSPGHVDFSSEVSTASRLCDGGLVLVDVVEGVCTQTHTVLRQAWVEKVQPILVLNKIDRLITELKMTPQEAYAQLNQILEQVNAILGSFYSEALMEDATKKYEAHIALGDDFAVNIGDDGNDSGNATETGNNATSTMDDSDLYFSPERGNVIFASAIDGWAFRVSQFSQMYAAKLGVKESVLNKVMWGNYYLDLKAKKVIGRKGLKGRLLRPLFVQFVLDNIWAVYHNALMSHNREKVEKIVKTINVKILPRDLKSKDLKSLVQNIMTQWLPLSRAVLLAVVQHVPSPLVAQKLRLPQILYPNVSGSSSSILYPGMAPSESSTAMPMVSKSSTHQNMANFKERSALDQAVYGCDSSPEAPIVVYISKMFSVPRNLLPKLDKQISVSPDAMRLRRQEIIQKSRALDREKAIAGIDDMSLSGSASAISERATIIQLPPSKLSEPSLVAGLSQSQQSENDEVLLGFARIYSGTIRVGQTLNIFDPKYDAMASDAENAPYRTVATVQRLFLLMGRDLEDLDCVPAGNVFGIMGLEKQVLKSATASSSLTCPSLSGVHMDSKPIVRVALEPTDPTQMSQLMAGLALLNRADPCVEVILEDSGRICLRDLRERFARISIQASPPIVPFRETLSINPATSQPAMGGILLKDNPIDTISVSDVNTPLQTGTVILTTKNKICTLRLRAVPFPPPVRDFLSASAIRLQEFDLIKDLTKRAEEIRQFNVELLECLSSAVKDGDGVVAKVDWESIIQGIVCFGPKGVGSNVLSCTARNYSMSRWNQSNNKKEVEPQHLNTDADDHVEDPSDLQRTTQSKTVGAVEFENSFVAGFQISVLSGPLCGEPMSGVCIVIEDVQFHIGDDQVEASRYATIPGQIIATMRQAIKQSFLQWSPRLMLAMYSCDLQTPTDILGKVYGVLNRRRGRVLSEDLKEGTPFFQVLSDMPVVESFGFTDELRTKTSGAASPQLLFIGFQVLDQDPFWVPTTEEELEDLGEKADRDNLAKKYMDAVRKRKVWY